VGNGIVSGNGKYAGFASFAFFGQGQRYTFDGAFDGVALALHRYVINQQGGVFGCLFDKVRPRSGAVITNKALDLADVGARAGVASSNHNGLDGCIFTGILGGQQQAVWRTRAVVDDGGGNAQAGVAVDGFHDAFQAGLILCDGNRLGFTAYRKGDIHTTVRQL